MLELFFTKDVLHKIEVPKEKQNVYKDTKEKGLILIVSYGGSKTFYLGKTIGKKYPRIKIGRFPDLSITAARVKAAELKNQIAKGINPMEEKAKLSNELTFKELFDKYINNYAKHNNKRWQYCVATINRQAKDFYPMKISTIQKSDIQKTFNDITKAGKYSANRFLEMLSPVFNKGIEWELLQINPVSGIKKHKERSRDRYITREELPRFFQALNQEKNQIMKDFILIALFTGVRKDNVLTMCWEHISFVDKKWYIPDTKNGEPYTVTLADAVIKILEERKRQSNNEWVFPSDASKTGHLQEPRKALKRICQRAEIRDLRIHDLRRTHGSWMAMSGANQYIISKALNHKNPGSTAVYARVNLDPVREFVEKVVNDIIAIAGQKES